MTKRFLTYFILALVVFQSAVGIADAHQSHQSGTEHLTFDDHQHAHEDVEVDHKLVDGAEGQERDCHHCCHCHGHFTSAVLVKPSGFVLNKSSTSNTDYSENFPSKVINPLLRPPIAHT
ncbi:hypothetical protein [Sessilibacter corallicola]|uniref:Cobalt transporter n=1 Tax=Sessilibacter corallicola TaxID=2904075 RepID=A0ABQ0ADA5_9GAMM